MSPTAPPHCPPWTPGGLSGVSPHQHRLMVEFVEWEEVGVRMVPSPASEDMYPSTVLPRARYPRTRSTYPQYCDPSICPACSAASYTRGYFATTVLPSSQAVASQQGHPSHPPILASSVPPYPPVHYVLRLALGPASPPAERICGKRRKKGAICLKRSRLPLPTHTWLSSILLPKPVSTTCTPSPGFTTPRSTPSHQPQY